MAPTIYEIRDALAEATAEHEADCDNPGCQFRIDVIAFLAHCLGVKKWQGDKVVRELERIELACTTCTHGE